MLYILYLRESFVALLKDLDYQYKTVRTNKTVFLNWRIAAQMGHRSVLMLNAHNKMQLTIKSYIDRIVK